MSPSIPRPWGAFLAELDGKLSEEVELVCLGGFVVAMQYGLERPTADIDVFEVRTAGDPKELDAVAGPNSPLFKKHKVFVQKVNIVTLPEGIEDRLTEMFPGTFRRLRLLALDPYDLALSKLDRNVERDREDVYYLADAVPLDLDVLQARYREEMRSYLGDGIQVRADKTLELWIAAIQERRAK